MSPEERDPAHLWDMLDAAKKIVRFTCGVTREDYFANSMMRDAVERNLSIIGEAARRVSQGFRESHPRIPWRRIIGLRNVLVHEYNDVDHREIWGLIVERIPSLIGQLGPLIEPLVPPEETEE